MHGLKTAEVCLRGRRGDFPAWLAGALCVGIVLGGVLWAPSLQAQPPPVPSGATPGGALPVPPTSPPRAPVPADLEPFPVPPAVERPLDADIGERLFVARFVLKGARDHPEQGIQVRVKMDWPWVNRNGWRPPAVCSGSSHCNASASGELA